MTETVIENTTLDYGNTTPTNTSTIELPVDMTFSESNMISIIVYTILLVISGIGNSIVFWTLYQRQTRRKSRINMMIMHLAMADLCVTFLNMPLEIAWKATVFWRAGDAMCRIMAFFRIFGLYLSSFILICISVDRYAAIKYPLRIQQAHRRGKWMIVCSWIFASACSAPQMYVFHVAVHHQFPWYKQCVTFGSFNSDSEELIYSMLAFVGTYAIPLVVIILCYAGILTELHKQSKNNKADKSEDSLELRRSGSGNIGKAKIQTIKMTMVIIITFIVCWTPYYVISLWYWFFKTSASQIDLRIERILLAFAVSNSCFNPIVYGYFSIKSSLMTIIRQSLCCCFDSSKNGWKMSKIDHSRTRQTYVRTTVNTSDHTVSMDTAAYTKPYVHVTQF